MLRVHVNGRGHMAMEKNSELLSRLVVKRNRDGRCRYDPAAKEELIRSCLKPGVSIARLAMQHKINANLLRTWVTKYQKENAARQKQAISESAQACVAAFTPVQIEMPSANCSPPNVFAVTPHSPETGTSSAPPLFRPALRRKCRRSVYTCDYRMVSHSISVKPTWMRCLHSCSC